MASTQDIPNIGRRGAEPNHSAAHGPQYRDQPLRPELNPSLDLDTMEPKLRAQVGDTVNREFAKAFPAGVTVVPALHAPKTPHDLELANALMLSLTNERNTHQDRVILLDGVSQLISADIDAKGALSATVHGPGSPSIPAASKFGSVAAAVDALQSDFKVKLSRQTDFPNGSNEKAFTLEELEKTHASFSLFSPKERQRLEGIELTRVEHLEGDFVAEHRFQPGTVLGASLNRITLAEGAFTSDKTSFVGTPANPVPRSVAIIAHEAAHAIEASEVIETAKQFESAQAAARQAVTNAGRVIDAADGQLAKNSPLLTAGKEVRAAIESLSLAREPGGRKAAEAKLSTALQHLDAQVAKLASKPGGVLAARYAEALREAVGPARRASDAGLAARDAEKVTACQLRFNLLMASAKQGPVTAYAGTGNRDSFAESLMLFKTDPEWMKKNAPAVYDWFAAGKHLE